MTSDQPWWLTMPPAELAATILPLFSSSTNELEESRIRAIAKWCKTGKYREPAGYSSRSASRIFEDPDLRAVAEATQVLEHASLLMRSFPIDGGSYVGVTRLGMHALQTNTVRQHLGLSATPSRPESV
jgi:hypothetical protein